MYQLFQHLTVVELASVLAGPSVGQFFAELGAKVIKIENPRTGGDVTRSWKLPTEAKETTISAYFSAVNWGKESLRLDLTQETALTQLYQLIKESDIVIASYKPQDAEKLKVDYKTLRQINGQLIYGHITGYGVDNPKVGYDAIIQAEAGFVDMNGTPTGDPVKLPVALMDVLAAHQLKEALLIALMHRAQTQEGSYVQVSLLESAVASLANQATNWLNAGKLPQRMGSEHPNIVPYGSIFTTLDEQRITLAVGTDKQFVQLCKLLSLPNVATDPLYASNQQRVKNKATLLPILQGAIQQWPKEKLLKKLEAARIPAGSVNTLKEVFENNDLQEIMLQDKATVLRGVRQLVAKFDKGCWTTLSPPPP
ncbi:MAG: CaiB/BaiF CoA transferase family protein [Thermonemataceae bacterium]